MNVIINNAGVALNVSFEHMQYEDLKWLMDTTIGGGAWVHGLLPKLKKAKWGHIVNLSSLFGLIGVPNQTAHNSAKFAVRGLSESLRMELEMAGYPIGVSCVHPGGIKTNIANSARLGQSVGKQMSDQQFGDRFNKLAQTSAKSAAKPSLKRSNPTINGFWWGWMLKSVMRFNVSHPPSTRNSGKYVM